jgi:gliding motility-associated-like protein
MKLRLTFILLILIGVVNINSSAQCGACFEQVQLIQNGNFSSGNTGFTTELNLGTGFFCPLCSEGTYAIGTNAFFYHNDFTGNDHTNPPSGSFFIANGIGQSGMEVWCQVVDIEPNTDYTFSFWARDVTNNSNPHPLAQLQPTFNGVPIGELLVAQGGWQQGVLNWNSGNLNQVTICILNMEVGTGGNDFGLDDISLTGCHPVTLMHQANAGADATICGGSSLGIGMPNYNGYQYSWTNSTSLNSTAVSSPTFSSTNNTTLPITEELVLTLDSASVGCISTDTIVITIQPIPSISLGADLTICPGENAVLTANGTWDNLTWSTTETSSEITVSASGQYTAVAELNGCTISDSQNVNFVNMPEIDLGADQEICEGGNVILSAPVIGSWSTGVNGNSITVTSQGDYSFTYTNQGCEVSDTMHLEVYTIPIVTLDDEYSYCENSNLELTIDQVGAWSTGEISTSIFVNSPGTYSVIVQNGPCQAADGTIVNEILIPQFDFEDEYYHCEDQSFWMEAPIVDGYTYLWNTGSHFQRQSFGAGSGWLTVSNECGSHTEEFLVYEEICDWGLWIPSSFTPNGDLINDTWFVEGYNISNFEVIVYNRFGDKIWGTTKLLDEWDPKDLAPSDNCYTYRAEAIDYNGNPILKFGYITIMR